MKIKKVLIITLILVSAASAFTKQAHSRSGRRNRRLMPRYYMLYRHLDNKNFLSQTGISRTKANKMKNLIKSSKKQSIPILAKLRVLRLDYQEEIEKDNLNKITIIAIAKKMHDLLWELRKIHINVRISSSKLLTKQERRKTEEFLRERFRKRWRRGRRRFQK